MRDRLFPNYPDDTDYTTNAPSYLDDLARKNKLIKLLSKKIWEYDERLDKRLEDLENVLQDYLSQWDNRIENLDDEVSHIFVTWLNDGTLEQIINHDVLGNKADKSYVDVLNETVYEHMKQIERNPLDYGVTNDGVLTQEALNNLEGGYKYKFPPGVYRVSGVTSGFILKDNTTYEFEDGAILTLDGNASPRYAVISIGGIKNFKLINPQIIGERYEHDYTLEGTHEWGRGIYITGDSTGVIINPRIKDCTGDAIDIIATVGSDIEIHGGILENNRRNNLSVESVDRLRVYNTELKNANGTAPQMGLDIEPYETEHILNDVKFYNIHSHSNAKESLMLTNLTKNNNIEFIGGTFEDIRFGFNLTTFDNNEVVFNQPLIKGYIYNRSSSPKATFLQPTIIITEDYKSNEAVITFEKVAWSRNDPGYMTFIGMNVLNPHDKEMDLVLFKSKDYAENRLWQNIIIDVNICELNGGYASDVSSRIYLYNTKLGTIPNVKIPITNISTLEQLNRSTYLLPVGVTITNEFTTEFTQFNFGQFLSTGTLTNPEVTLLNTKDNIALSIYSSAFLYPKKSDGTSRTAFTSRDIGDSITMERIEFNSEKQWVATKIIGNWDRT